MIKLGFKQVDLQIDETNNIFSINSTDYKFEDVKDVEMKKTITTEEIMEDTKYSYNLHKGLVVKDALKSDLGLFAGLKEKQTYVKKKICKIFLTIKFESKSYSYCTGMFLENDPIISVCEDETNKKVDTIKKYAKNRKTKVLIPDTGGCLKLFAGRYEVGVDIQLEDGKYDLIVTRGKGEIYIYDKIGDSLFIHYNVMDIHELNRYSNFPIKQKNFIRIEGPLEIAFVKK